MLRLSEHCGSTISGQCFHWWFKSSVSLGEWLRTFWVVAVPYLPNSNCPLKLTSPRSLWNIRNCQSPNGTPTNPRSVNPQENCC